MKQLASILTFMLLSVSAQAYWLPFRIALADMYTDADTYQNEVSSIYGLRIGLLEAVNHGVYGISLTIGADGGRAADGAVRQFVDNDFVGFKVGGFSTAFSGSGFGFQFAGFRNSGGDMAGFQIAGVGDNATFMRGFQFAGIYCYSEMEMMGMQVAGLASIVKPDGNDVAAEAAGLQIGGIYSGCYGVFSGVQIGCFNFARDMYGVQIGIINNTASLHGVQIGAINISGTSARGDLFVLPVLNIGFM